MKDPIETYALSSWSEAPDAELAQRAQRAIEAGSVLLFPQLAFALSGEERGFLTPGSADGSSKNVSYEDTTGDLHGTALAGAERQALTAMMARFARQSRQFVAQLFPGYAPHLEMGRTSFRPVEAEGRVSSYRKDDTRLHVDAFASRPNQGRRILRLFCNVNPDGKPRVWNVGEPFESFAGKFCARASAPVPGSAWLMERLGVTKGRRSLYDHYMLQLHDRGKADLDYQRDAEKVRIEFPPGSTWVVFTDRVLHAALSGQYLFEQTFHLPVAAMSEPRQAPLAILEQLMQRQLV
ncbi:MAG TPA: Kdo hydroxylase family protein [Burkholderiales bacterium]|nr:Kdo hydroxylase family protein [Burkholderiales bacterium]